MTDSIIGVAHAGRSGSLASWKRDILFFNKIFVADASSAIGVWRKAPWGDIERNRQDANELEYLLSTGHFITRDKDIAKSILDDPSLDPGANFKSTIEKIVAIVDAYETIVGGFTDMDDLAHRLRRNGMRDLTRTHASLNLGLEAAFQRSQGLNSVVHGELAWQLTGETTIHPGQVVELTIQRVPVPHENTPWEEVFAIKDNPDIQMRARKLRLWINEINKPGMTLQRVDEYISDAVSDYENYMKAQKIKLRSSIMKAAVIGVGEFFEDLLHARIGKLASRAFAAQEKHADLVIGEARAPGRQLSLITALKEKIR